MPKDDVKSLGPVDLDDDLNPKPMPFKRGMPGASIVPDNRPTLPQVQVKSRTE